MKAHQAEHAVATMCDVLGLSRSGYYAWLARPPSDRAQEELALRAAVAEAHRQSRGTYGAPRVRAELAAQGRRVSKKRVARLMAVQGLQGVHRRKGVVTTRRGEEPATADLVKRNFTADGPDRLWVADITYVPTAAGFLYLAIVLDVWSRKVVGWAMETHLRTELVLAALDMAVAQREPEGVIHHSDHGCQYTSIALGERAHQAGLRLSFGSVGDAYDNAMAESFFATLECELLDRSAFRTPAEARRALFAFIEGFYNTTRRHSALGYRSPCDFERAHADGSPHNTPSENPQVILTVSTGSESPPPAPPPVSRAHGGASPILVG